MVAAVVVVIVVVGGLVHAQLMLFDSPRVRPLGAQQTTIVRRALRHRRWNRTSVNGASTRIYLLIYFERAQVSDRPHRDTYKEIGEEA